MKGRGRVRRGIVVGILTIAAFVIGGASAQADVTIPGGLGGEILANPVPGSVVSPPNVLPLPPPLPAEPGFVPAPAGPALGGGVHDGPGSGPPAPPPLRIDADAPPAEEPGETGDPEAVGTLTLDPSEIRQSQTSVKRVAEIEASMRADGWVGEPIDVVRMPDGKLTTIDNTRLLAAKRAGIDVRANVHNFKDPITGVRADTLASRKGVVPKTWGEAVLIRIGRQNVEYRTAYPSGSPITGWNGN